VTGDRVQGTGCRGQRDKGQRDKGQRDKRVQGFQIAAFASRSSHRRGGNPARYVGHLTLQSYFPWGSLLSMRFAVLCKGILRGMGREASCELLATKTVLPEAAAPVYSHCAVIEAPRDLPDGDYEVEFAGEVAVVTLRSGSWMVGRILPHTYSEAATFYAQEVARTVAQTPKVQRRKTGRSLKDWFRADGT
jgi:hypothetical protein